MNVLGSSLTILYVSWTFLKVSCCSYRFLDVSGFVLERCWNIYDSKLTLSNSFNNDNHQSPLAIEFRQVEFRFDDE